ncbi:hypothetical protein K0M31_006972 [Melipona bicolor]|uniref:Uncharacterized protein n=1 Tax=Melipona bicolor TaxID=60889 RepID=A0AA40KKM9_9HYME|nr:hypothetical protein K0M31_006972 [Melipona bicolor]
MNPAEVFPSAIGRGPWSLNRTVKIKYRQDDGGGLATEENQSYRPSNDRGKENEWNEPAGGAIEREGPDNQREVQSNDSELFTRWLNDVATSFLRLRSAMFPETVGFCGGNRGKQIRCYVGNGGQGAHTLGQIHPRGCIRELTPLLGPIEFTRMRRRVPRKICAALNRDLSSGLLLHQFVWRNRGQGNKTSDRAVRCSFVILVIDSVVRFFSFFYFMGN